MIRTSGGYLEFTQSLAFSFLCCFVMTSWQYPLLCSVLTLEISEHFLENECFTVNSDVLEKHQQEKSSRVLPLTNFLCLKNCFFFFVVKIYYQVVFVLWLNSWSKVHCFRVVKWCIIVYCAVFNIFLIDRFFASYFPQHELIGTLFLTLILKMRFFILIMMCREEIFQSKS